MSLSPQEQNSLPITPKRNTVYLFIKRAIDILASSLALIFLSPIFALTAIAIKIEDPRGKVFFAQERYGIGCVPFRMYKFRSMYSNAESLLSQLTPKQRAEWDTSFKFDKDPRITKVGAFIRKVSIDELPQLVNILFAQMSIVGPRPPLLVEKDAYGKTLPLVMSVKPGLTGYWQAYGRSDIPHEERITMNLFYIENMSLLFDIKIIFRTAIGIFKGGGAK